MTEMGVPGQEPKKGMSKGCMVTLIVVAVLVVMVVVAGVVCYAKRDELVKAGMGMTLSKIQAELMANPVEGVDTVMVNRVAEAFIEKVKNDSTSSAEEYAYFFQTVQGIMGDRVVDAEEVQQLIETMVTTYPELGELIPDEPPGEMDGDVGVEEDSLSTEQ